MNGKTFSVTETREVIDRTLGISDPDKFKEAMPWHTEPPIGVSKDKLVADGMSIPPFHGRCRCVLVMASEGVANFTQPMPIESHPEPNPNVEMMHGVSKDEIDRLRGVRGHGERNSITVSDIVNDYKRVGINVTKEYAERVQFAIKRFTGAGYSSMRSVFLKSARGKVYPEGASGYENLELYKLCDEYSKIAPTYQGVGKEILRGVHNSGSKYSQMLLGLTSGDEFDLQMPSSFTTDRQTAHGFAGFGGILFHVSDTDILDAPSLEGLSSGHGECEVLVSDRLWVVEKVEDKRLPPEMLYDPQGIKDGYYHITLKRKR